jgi:hypothetical protein
MVQAGLFPRPVHITERNGGYVREAVEAWMKARTEGAVPFCVPNASPELGRPRPAGRSIRMASFVLMG